MSAAPAPDLHVGRSSQPIHDTWVIAKRGLLHMRRQPEALTDATIQPIMFVLLFAYVFGGAIVIDGGAGDYKEFLMGGIFAQTLTFGVFGAAMALAADRKNGAVDRFRSLPIAKGAVLGGLAVANLIKGLLPIILMSLTGLVVGWRTHSSALEVAGAYGLMILFTFAMIWVGVLLGSKLPSPEAVQGVAFVAIFPLTFIASTFVPTESLPGVLQTFAEWNPVSSLATALRDLFGNSTEASYAGAPWPVTHAIEYTLIWNVLIIGVCAPLAVRIYQRSIAT
ncbi:MAG: ABC transporter permease [Solirubrobacteraceae bacterium]|nr:ABC transporter permease [Solirubrobacteraceae bacterium]